MSIRTIEVGDIVKIRATGEEGSVVEVYTDKADVSVGGNIETVPRSGLDLVRKTPPSMPSATDD